MDIDFADLLMEVVLRRASDLHLSAAAHPTVRVRGRLTPLEEYPRLSATDTREIQAMTLERRPAEEIRDVAVRQGMRRLREDGLEKVRQGRTSIAEVLRVIGSS